MCQFLNKESQQVPIDEMFNSRENGTCDGGSTLPGTSQQLVQLLVSGKAWTTDHINAAVLPERVQKKKIGDHLVLQNPQYEVRGTIVKLLITWKVPSAN